MGLESYIAALYKMGYETDTFVAIAKRQSPEILQASDSNTQREREKESERDRERKR